VLKEKGVGQVIMNRRSAAFLRKWGDNISRKENNTYLCPDLKEGIPATRAEGHTIDADTQAAEAIVVARKNPDTFTFESIPNIASPVIVTSEKDAARDGEGNGCDTAKNVVACEAV